MNQKDLLATVAVSQTIKECSVGLAIEHRFTLDEIRTGSANIHRTKDLLSVALTGRGDKRLSPASSPSLIQARILAKAGLVGEKQRGTPISGFFLAWDRCNAANDPAEPDRLWLNACADVGPKIPIP
jgi:hypothetical protein